MAESSEVTEKGEEKKETESEGSIKLIHVDLGEK
jgi:hypothetical protein